MYLVDMEIKNWIKAARLDAHLTQEQLGEMLGLTKGNISSWEKGRHEPSFNQMKKICEITRYPLPIEEWMMRGSTSITWPFKVGYEQYAQIDQLIKEAMDKFLSIAAKEYPISNDDYTDLTESINDAIKFMRTSRSKKAANY